MGRSRQRISACATAAIAISCASYAHAAQSEQNGGMGVHDDEIIVTAQKTATSLDETAAVIVAIRGADLAQSGIADVTNLSSVVPGVSFTQVGSSVNINIRGVGSASFSALSGAGIGFVQDGVALEGNLGLLSGFYDLERVEVLKGPQGTLYGLNSSGGVVSVVSARPRIGQNSGGFDLEFGNYDHVKASGHVNLALGSNVAARISGDYDYNDGYVSGTYNDKKNGGLRGQLLFQGEAVSVLVAGDYFHQGGVGNIDFLLPFGRAGLQNGDPFKQYYYPNQGTDAFVDGTYWSLRGELKADLGFAELTVIPGYRDMKSKEIFYSVSRHGQQINTATQTSVEARLAGDAGPVDWLVGGYTFWGDRDSDGHYYRVSGAPPNTIVDRWTAATRFGGQQVGGPTHNESRAVFGQLTWSVTDRLRLVGGLRYSHDIREMSATTNSALAGPTPGTIPVSLTGGVIVAPGWGLTLPAIQALNPSQITLTVTPLAARSEKFSNVDFKLGVQYDIAPDSLIYANISTGYKSGGINTGSSGSVGTAYDKETLTAYDLGVRTRIGALRAHVNGFYWAYKNHQEGAIYTVDPPGVGTMLLIQNLPKGKLYGADLELDWRPTPDDKLGLQVAWLESDTGPFTIGPAGVSQVIEPQGHAYTQAPRWTLNGDLEHVFHLGDYELVGKAEGQYQSASNLEIRFKSATVRDPYFTGNLFLTLRPESTNWYVGAYVRNVTDKTYLVAAQRAPGPADDFWGLVGAPRTFGVRAGVNF